MTPRTVFSVVLSVTILFALAPLYRPHVELPIREHHLLHAVVLIGAALSGLLCARVVRHVSRIRTLWLIVAILAPMLAMLLMWPSEYSPLDKLPAAHTVEHLGLVVLGFATAFAGERYANGVGVAMSLSLWMMALLAAWGFGVSPRLQVQGASAEVARAPSTSVALRASNANHGQDVFKQNCASCHGAQGEGGMGPSLRNEAARKNFAQAVRWIENPQPPMPKLYPAPLGVQDVRDVAAYVESLK
jgi:mono/diheme cytochrome c family protein